MLRMRRSVKQKVVAAAAVAVLLGGAAFAAVSATGQANSHAGKHARHGARRLRTHDLSAAASYLGTTTAALAGELSSGKSLAQIAAAHGDGKTASGLVEAIVAERKARLQRTAANLPSRVSAEVARPGGPSAGLAGAGGSGPAALAMLLAPKHLGASAASYLGVSLAQLRSDLEGGKTLAQLAAATPGKSSDGLIAALAAAKLQQLAARAARASSHRSAAGHRSSDARSKQQAGRLQKRIDRLVARKFARD
jgi:hypothetical protein